MRYCLPQQFFYFFGLSFGMIALIVSCNPKPESLPGQLSEQALSTFELAPGFRIELVASEPLVADPVAMEIDENGQMYVVEMHGYPLDKSGTGKIKLLSDTDGDGRMDKSTVFAEGLILPTGIMRWKQGVLVTDTPDVLYLEDTTGDGEADIREVVLTGFALSNPQHNLNHPLLGLDNWIYLAHEGAVATKTYQKEFGDPGKAISYPNLPDAPHLPQNANGRSVRFQPENHALEMLSSKSQFGQTFDAWGNYFVVTNANHVLQEVIAAAYLNRNPDLLVSDATQSISDHGNAAEVFPITKNPENQLLTDVGVITSACGITAYLGGAFPEDYNANVVFVAEPVSNLVHADRLKPQGASFTASRMLENKEFLASTDAWFRPVNMYIGPDGALYLVDYYRQIIEHPEWMAEEVVKSGALYHGTDQGRIYRISASAAGPATWTSGLTLGNATNEQLVEKLADQNIWWRRNAQRLLIDRNDAYAIPALLEMAENGDSPYGRLHALWTLEGMRQLPAALITKALRDQEAGVRKNAVKLAERHLNNSPYLTTVLLTLQGDPDPLVRYQLLCTLGFVDTPEADQVRQALLFEDINDPWVQVAALSAPSSQNAKLLEAVLSKFKTDNPAYASLVQRLSAMAGANQDPKVIQQLLQKATAPDSEKRSAWQAPVLEGLARGLQSRKSMPLELEMEQSLLMRTSLSHPSVPVRNGALRLLRVIGLPEGSRISQAREKARQMAADGNLPEAQRATAIDFLALDNPEPYSAFLTGLITPSEPLSVQLAALHAMDAIPDQTVTRFVLKHWSTLTPEIRDAALNTFMQDTARIRLLLNAVEAGTIQQANIGWPRSVRLMAQPNEQLRNKARVLLTRKNDKRKDVIPQYQSALELEGNQEKGKLVYQAHCATCHQKRGTMGVAFGPDLGTVHNWPPAGIMTHILDPNQSISDGYDLWDVVLTNGATVQGIISTETPNALTLRNVGGQEATIARQDIKSIKALGMSAMPAGLENQIDKQDMADLLAFLKQVE